MVKCTLPHRDMHAMKNPKKTDRGQLPGDTPPLPGLSVVVPAFNEEKYISKCIAAVRDYLDSAYPDDPGRAGPDYEVIVVDDGSSDKTVPVVVGLMGPERPWLKLIQNSANRGKGFSVRAGMLAAKRELVLMTDTDLSTPMEEVEALRAALKDGADIAIGSRGLPGSRLEKRQNPLREAMGRTFNLLVRLLSSLPYKDTQCGFKLLTHKVAKDIFGISVVDGFGFDVELLFLARRSGYSIMEIPVRWVNCPDSRVRIIRDSVGMFLELLGIRLRWARGAYNRQAGNGSSRP